jgi:hypothetical protein
MPMSLTQLFLYFLMVVLFWAWPIILVTLIVGIRKKRVLRTLAYNAIGIPLVVLIVLLATSSGIIFQDYRTKRQSKLTSGRFVSQQKTTIYEGAFIDTTQRGNMKFRRFVFRGLLTDTNRNIEILLPSANITALAHLRGASVIAQKNEAARLVVLNDSGVVASPRGNPAEYLQTNFPSITPDIPITNIVIITLNGDESFLWYPTQTSPSKWWYDRVRIDSRSLRRN